MATLCVPVNIFGADQVVERMAESTLRMRWVVSVHERLQLPDDPRWTFLVSKNLFNGVLDTGWLGGGAAVDWPAMDMKDAAIQVLNQK